MTGSVLKKFGACGWLLAVLTAGGLKTAQAACTETACISAGSRVVTTDPAQTELRNALIGASSAPTSFTISGSSAGLEGVDSIELRARIVESPVSFCGPVGTAFHTGAMRFKLSVEVVQLNPDATALNTIPGVTGAGIVLGHFDLYAEVGQAEGTITAIDSIKQTLTVQATPGVVNLYLGQIDDGVFFNTTRAIDPQTDLNYGAIGTLTVNGSAVEIQARSMARGDQPSASTLNFTGPYPQTLTAGSSTASGSSLADTLIRDMQLRLNPSLGPLDASLLPPLQAIVADAFTPLFTTALTDVFEPAMETFGMRYGEVDVTAQSVSPPCLAFSFDTDGQQTALPGSVVFYTHSAIADREGRLTFSATAPDTPGWTHAIFLDANCNGAIDSGENAIAGPLSTNADQKICIVAKVFVPAGAPYDAQYPLTVAAHFSYANDTLSADQSRSDLTIVGSATDAGLHLSKQVDKTAAKPGEPIVYTLTYLNSGSAALTDLKIHDATPAYTVFDSAACDALPAGLTACSLSVQPAAGAAGPIEWSFAGELAPGASGTVTFSVILQ